MFNDDWGCPSYDKEKWDAINKIAELKKALKEFNKAVEEYGGTDENVMHELVDFFEEVLNPKPPEPVEIKYVIK